MKVPVDDWFIFKEDALKYLNSVAMMIRIQCSPDPFISETIDSFPVLLAWPADDLRLSRSSFEFRFEPDRGRILKGFTYRIMLNGAKGITLAKIGTDTSMSVKIELSNIFDLSGKHLLHAINELMCIETMNC